MPFEISDEDWSNVLRGVARGQYNLLLGAGASVDAENRNGNALPTGSQLVELLVDHFQIDAEGERLTLQRAYNLAARRAQDRGEAIDEYLAEILTQTRPPEWYRTLCTTNWKRVWTLNVDDVIEQAYD